MTVADEADELIDDVGFCGAGRVNFGAEGLTELEEVVDGRAELDTEADEVAGRASRVGFEEVEDRVGATLGGIFVS